MTTPKKERLPDRLYVNFNDSEVTFPLSWEQTTLGQFLELRKGHIDAGEDLDKLTKSTLRALASDWPLLLTAPDPRADVKVINRLAFLTAFPDFSALPVPDSLTIDGKTVRVPESLSLESFGQKLAVDNALKNVEEEEGFAGYINAAPWLLGIYLYPKITGQPFTVADHVEAILPQILALPVTKALPLSAFFLTSWETSTHSGKITYRVRGRQTLLWSRLKLWFRSWRRTKSTS